MENLKAHIFDLAQQTKPAEQYKYGVDYDFVFESFDSEFKLDVKRLHDIQQEYKLSSSHEDKNRLETEFYELYPECVETNLLKAEIPDTVLKRLYFVQSPKAPNGLPAIHYSLKEKMLSDYRAQRKKVKGYMAEACKAGDHAAEVRWNAMQLAIKVICNSEYGASNNKFFAICDNEISSTITRNARQLISFLTENLESSELFVDKKFLDSQQKEVENLTSIGAIKIEKIPHPLASPSNITPNYLLKNRRHCIRRLFNDVYELNTSDIYKVTLKPSIVCYQDTDSNYYKNEYIANYWTKNFTELSPEIIDKCMHSMLFHDNFICNFIKESIARKPYELGFEGAFIVCRYLNRKKKYYGIKWGDDAELSLAAKIDNPQAYDPRTGYLIPNYMPYWKPKKTVIPQPNGDYIYIDSDKLLHQNINLLDYVKGQDVKCTGVDLARRDQFKFINFIHILILQQDLRIMSYEGEGKWKVISLAEKLETIIDKTIDMFKTVMNKFQLIANLELFETPEYDFSIYDFAKNGAYRPGKQNTVTEIVQRLKYEHKEQYIPGIGERMTYVTLLDDVTRNNRNQGKAAETNTSKRSFVVQEIYDNLKTEFSEEDFNLKLIDKGIDKETCKITYDKYIDAKAISLLDVKWYLEYLCKSVALYVVGDKFPNEIRAIDDGIISPKDAGPLISKLQEKVAKEYVNKYFPSGKDIKKELTFSTSKSKVKTSRSKSNVKSDENLVYETFNIDPSDGVTQRDIEKYKSKLMSKLDEYKELHDEMFNVFTFIVTDNFHAFTSKNPRKVKFYETYKNDPGSLKQLINRTREKISERERVLKALLSFNVSNEEEDES